MNYRLKNICEVNNELKIQLKKLNAQSEELSNTIHKISVSDEGLEKTLKVESEIMTAITTKAKLLPNNRNQLGHSFSQIIQFVIDQIDSNKITNNTVEKDQLLFNKIADLSYRFESFYKDNKEQFMLFENIRNLLRNLAGILL